MMNKIFEILKIISLSRLTRIVVLSLFLIFLTLGLFESLLLSPEDYIQSDAVRIMYVHVPAAWISLGIFSFMAFLSLGIFIFKNKNFIIIAKSFAPSGLWCSQKALEKTHLHQKQWPSQRASGQRQSTELGSMPQET